MKSRNEIERGCTDLSKGNLISEYELDLIDEAGRQEFEVHLFECEFCRDELSYFQGTASLLREHREEIATALKAQKRLVSEGIGTRIKNLISEWLDPVLQPWILVPSLSGVAVALLLVVMLNGGNNYDQFVTMSALPYQTEIVRGDTDDGAETLFQKGMAAYATGDYRAAVESLEKTVKQTPANFRYRTYLGVSYFMLKKPRKALNELTKADQLTRFALKDELHWYIFQSHLMAGNLKQADAIRGEMKANGERFASQADSIWQILETQDGKIASEK